MRKTTKTMQALLDSLEEQRNNPASSWLLPMKHVPIVERWLMSFRDYHERPSYTGAAQSGPSKRKERDDLRAERDDLRAERVQLQAENEALRADLEKVQTQLDEALRSPAGDAAENDKLLTQLTALRGELNNAKLEIATLKAGGATREQRSTYSVGDIVDIRENARSAYGTVFSGEHRRGWQVRSFAGGYVRVGKEGNPVSAPVKRADIEYPAQPEPEPEPQPKPIAIGDKVSLKADVLLGFRNGLTGRTFTEEDRHNLSVERVSDVGALLRHPNGLDAFIVSAEDIER